MKEKLVSFQTANLAEEKGCELNIYGNQNEMLVLTQNLLQKWLREVHNIEVEPYLIICKHNNREIPQLPEEKEYDYKIIVSGISQYIGTIQNDLSYEEALEKGLQEALKLIK